MKHLDVVIIGAGAAGLMAAIEAGKRGRRVLVLDSANKVGKKILMSGGGRCNFTNLHVEPHHYLSANPHFCKSALARYTSDHFIHLVKQHQIPFHEKSHGQLFCDNKASDIVAMLLSCCDKAHVDIRLKTEVQCITANGARFELVLASGERLSCQSLVVATGGLSIPTMGASPYGYQVAALFDVPILPTRAGLVPFTLQPEQKDHLSELSGVSVPCSVDCNGQVFALDMLFTHRGLSGPAMLQISSYWQPGDTLSIDLDPYDQWTPYLAKRKRQEPRLRLKQCFAEALPKRVVQTLFEEDLLECELQSLSDQVLRDVQSLVKTWRIKPNGTEGYRTAEVTLGGVDTRALSSQTMESNIVAGLYFIGEVLDVTGWLGGYNFQWAWSSGWAAGQVI